jgi:hypothetical protein
MTNTIRFLKGGQQEIMVDTIEVSFDRLQAARRESFEANLEGASPEQPPNDRQNQA